MSRRVVVKGLAAHVGEVNALVTATVHVSTQSSNEGCQLAAAAGVQHDSQQDRSVW